MKKFIFLIIVVAGVVIYMRGSNEKDSNEGVKGNHKILSVQGRVDGNLSLLGRSSYRLVSLKDTSRAYYVIAGSEAPSLGEVITVRLAKRELAILNDDTLAVYTEQSKEIIE